MKIPDKLYLDTNIIEGYFKNAILARRKKREFRTPFILTILTKNKVKLFISTFTLAEIYEHLWKNYRVTPKETTKLTRKFLRESNTFLILRFSINGEVLRWIRKRMLDAKDVIHLSISMNNDLTILSADENFVNRGKGIYSKIISDKELRSIYFSSYQ